MAESDLLALFGARLKALRKERGWTQERMAIRAGCTRSYYTRLELGEQGPAFEKIADLARAFSIDELDLFCFPGATDRHDIAELLRNAPEPVRLHVLEVLREELQRHLHGDVRPAAAEAHRPRRTARVSK